jgi:hypothetical protein
MKTPTMPRLPAWSVSAGTKTRARRIALVTGLLVAINVAARLIVRFALPEGTDPFQLAAWSMLAMVVVVAVVGFRWTRQRRVPLVAGDLFFVTVATSLLVALAAPVVGGGAVFDPGLVLGQLALCVAFLVVGDAAGVLLAVALGLDPTSRAWKQQAERVLTKPRQSGARK